MNRYTPPYRVLQIGFSGRIIDQLATVDTLVEVHELLAGYEPGRCVLPRVAIDHNGNEVSAIDPTECPEPCPIRSTPR